MPNINLLTIGRADHDFLMKLTAEMLAMPYRACHSRDCRRALACRYRNRRSGEPCCLQQLDPAEREAFDQFFILVLRIADALAIERPGRSADARELEQAAIEIVLAGRRERPQLGHLFPDWLAKYRASELAAPQERAISNG